jgi:hypothetical protein
MSDDRPGPFFTSLHQYRDKLGRFSIRIPGDWQEFDLEDDREGVLFSPQEDAPSTYVAVWVSQLGGEHVVAEDLDVLREGVEEGLQQLDGIEITESKDDAISNLLKFERIYEFNEGGTRRKRRVWMLYIDTWSMVVIYQGETPAEYDYWLSMGNYALGTFNIPEALWFASDRELNGKRLTEGGESLTASSEDSELATATPGDDDSVDTDDAPVEARS